MKKMLLIAAREFAGYFRIPMALVVLPTFLALIGLYFYTHLINFQITVTPRPGVLFVTGYNLNDALLLPFLDSVLNVFYLVVPIVTMRLVSEEKRNNTWELLLTYPVRPWEILFGKYLGALAFIFMLLVLTLPYSFSLFFFGRPELMTLLSTYLGISLYLLFFVAVGLWASLLTENQIIAALITAGLPLGFIVLKWLAAISPPPFEAGFAHLLLQEHLVNFSHGLIRRSYLFIYPSITLLFILFCFEQVQKRR